MKLDVDEGEEGEEGVGSVLEGENVDESDYSNSNKGIGESQNTTIIKNSTSTNLKVSVSDDLEKLLDLD